MKHLTASDRNALIRLASSLPKGSEERHTLLYALSKSEISSVVRASMRKEASSAWRKVFGVLDKAFPRWNPNKVTDWNKVHAQFRGVTNDPGAAAHYYSEYRAGRMTQDEAIKGLQREGVRAPTPKNLTASDRNALIRLASQMPSGSEERKAILAGLSKVSREVNVPGKHIFDRAEVRDRAMVYDNARVTQNSQVFGNAQVYGDARVQGRSWVFGRARVYGKALLDNSVEVADQAEVFGKAKVLKNALVYENAKVFGSAIVDGANISGRAEVSGRTYIQGTVVVEGSAKITGGNWRMPSSVKEAEITVASGTWKSPDDFAKAAIDNADTGESLDDMLNEIRNADLSDRATLHIYTPLHVLNLSPWEIYCNWEARFGSTSTEVSDQALEWLKQGYTSKSEIEELIAEAADEALYDLNYKAEDWEPPTVFDWGWNTDSDGVVTLSFYETR